MDKNPEKGNRMWRCTENGVEIKLEGLKDAYGYVCSHYGSGLHVWQIFWIYKWRSRGIMPQTG